MRIVAAEAVAIGNRCMGVGARMFGFVVAAVAELGPGGFQLGFVIALVNVMAVQAVT